MILPISHKHKPTQARTSPIETRTQTDLQMRPPCETCPASSTEHKYPSTNSSQAPTCDDTNMYIVQSKPIKAHSWTTQCAALKSHLSGEVFDVCITRLSMLSITTDNTNEDFSDFVSTNLLLSASTVPLDYLRPMITISIIITTIAIIINFKQL